MAVKNEFFKSKLFYFLSLVFIIYFCNSIQGVFLAQMSSSWFHIDLVSIIIVYLCIEHHVLLAATLAVVAGNLMQATVTSPHVFFVLYFLFLFVLSNIISNFFVLSSLISKSIIFTVLYLSKYILFYFSLTNRYEIGLSPLFSVYWKEFIATAVCSFFVFQLLYYFDSLFMLPGTIKKR